MPDEDDPRCTVRQMFAKAAIDSISATHAAKVAFDAALLQPGDATDAAAAALQAARDAEQEAENALRNHIEQHGCKW